MLIINSNLDNLSYEITMSVINYYSLTSLYFSKILLNEYHRKDSITINISQNPSKILLSNGIQFKQQTPEPRKGGNIYYIGSLIAHLSS